MVQSLALIRSAISQFMNMQIYKHTISHHMHRRPRSNLLYSTHVVLPCARVPLNYLIKIQLTTTLCQELNHSHPLTFTTPHSKSCHPTRISSQLHFTLCCSYHLASSPVRVRYATPFYSGLNCVQKIEWAKFNHRWHARYVTFAACLPGS